MQDARQWSDPIAPRSLMRVWTSAIVLASVVLVPQGTELIAKEKRSRSTKEPARIATTVSEGTRTATTPAGEKHPLLPALKLARSSRDALAQIKDYETVFIKQERIKDQLTRQVMEMKFRQEPFSVYLKYLDPHSGREVIYVEGQNKGNFLVHEDGIKSLVGTLSFLPTCDEAMRENHYPVTKIGMANMLDVIIQQWDSELKSSDVEVKYYPNAKVGDQECTLIISLHPESRPQFKFHKTSLYLDKATNLPIRVEQFGFPHAAGEAPPLEEEYNYTSLKTNVGLTSHDFDTKNKNYKF